MFLHLSVCPRGGGWYSNIHCRSPGPHPGGSFEGSGLGGLQAHTWGGGSWGVWPGGVSRPTPGGVSRSTPGGVSRPTPRGVSRPTPRGGVSWPTARGGWVSQHALRQAPSPRAVDGYCCGRYASYCFVVELWNLLDQLQKQIHYEISFFMKLHHCPFPFNGLFRQSLNRNCAGNGTNIMPKYGNGYK